MTKPITLADLFCGAGGTSTGAVEAIEMLGHTAQGFRGDYIFTGTKTEQTKQIGNAVPRRLARALVLAALSQDADILKFEEITHA